MSQSHGPQQWAAGREQDHSAELTGLAAPRRLNLEARENLYWQSRGREWFEQTPGP